MRKKATTTTSKPAKTTKTSPVSKRETSEISALKTKIQKLTRKVSALEKWKTSIELRLEGVSKAIVLFDVASSGMATMSQVMNERMTVLLTKLTEVFPTIKDLDTDVMNNLMREIEGKVDKAVKSYEEEEEN